ncbi:NAD-dependent epimerase/dehydratase family protein [Salinisphaera hydrothermalis]|uniref:NAD-dependent epimerase/dehydratase domain-containing protein n=1 Tax=Salinisphaera hydrothermalis (strain C41B8) TaxID=1304275 RepID=A0A084IG58_SALHC|nr:NAD-dependent epimerase/dehydratase family protein [Salinisphaera hydrothermalis]KEZ75692.1 hypothetical protein C41B8_18682 [Salinisphaera hydrothermalis C41B8]
MAHTALVLGATGAIGSELAKKLFASGWQIRALHRAPEIPAGQHPAYDWRRGDAMNRAEVVDAARGASLIVHAVNPPGYRGWAERVLPMIDNTIAAARTADARIILPGTVYNYGPDAFPLIAEDAPQNPVTRKGAIRVSLEHRLATAAENEGVRSLIVRAGDYFGGPPANNWFHALVGPRRPPRGIRYPGRQGVGHQWAYVPDVAETMLRLATAENQLPVFARYHMRGHWDEDGTRMITAIRAAAGTHLPIRHFPWWSLRILGLAWETGRELRELRYLWQRSIRLDNTALLSHLGSEPHTPWPQAVAHALQASDDKAAAR